MLTPAFHISSISMATLLAGALCRPGRVQVGAPSRAQFAQSRFHRCLGRRSLVVRAHEAEQELPPELQGLCINEEGLLIDEKTGEVINEYQATRFDVAVRALRGEFDPPPGVDNTERNPGLLLESLMQFPGTYSFQVVLRNKAGAQAQELLAEVSQLVGRVCEAEVALEQCEAKQRFGGKFVSLTVPAVVRAPQIIHKVFEELGKDERVVMKY